MVTAKDADVSQIQLNGSCRPFHLNPVQALPLLSAADVTVFSSSHFRVTRRVSCSCGVGQGQATTALRGPSLFGGSLDHPDQRGRHSHHQLNPATLFRFSPRSLFGLVFPLFRLITRGPLGLLEDWHPPGSADSRLAELPPSLDSGRYPPSPDTTGLQQPRKSRTNPNDHHQRPISSF